MIGIDTNVLVRFITQDDSEQTQQANLLLLSEEKFFLPDITLAETVWLLARSYHWKREEITQALETLLGTINFVFEDETAVAHATWAYQIQGDWTDHLIQAKCKHHKCHSLATFDKKFSKLYPDFVNTLS